MKDLNENRDNVLRYMMLSVLGPHLDKYIKTSQKKLEEPETGTQVVSSPKPPVVTGQVSVSDRLDLDAQQSSVRGLPPASASTGAVENGLVALAITASISDGLPSEDKWDGILAKAEEIKKSKNLNEQNVAQIVKPDISEAESESLKKSLNLSKNEFKTLRQAYRIQAKLDALKAQQEFAKKAPAEVVMETGTFAGEDVSSHVNDQLVDSKLAAARVMESGQSSTEEESMFSSPRLLLFAAFNASTTLALNAKNAAYEYLSGAQLTREKLVEMERFRSICEAMVSEPTMTQKSVAGVTANLIDLIDGERGVQKALTVARGRNKKSDFGYSEELLQVYVCALKWLSEPEVAKALAVIGPYDKELGALENNREKVSGYALLSKQVMSDLFRMVFKIQVDGFLTAHKKLAHTREIDDTTRPLLTEAMLHTITDFNDIDATPVSSEVKQRNLLRMIDSVRRLTDVPSKAGLLKEIDDVLAAHELSVKDLSNVVSVTRVPRSSVSEFKT